MDDLRKKWPQPEREEDAGDTEKKLYWNVVVYITKSEIRWKLPANIASDKLDNQTCHKHTITRDFLARAGETMTRGSHCRPVFLRLLPNQRLWIVKNMYTHISDCLYINYQLDALIIIYS